jgi:hypothetical protein
VGQLWRVSFPHGDPGRMATVREMKAQDIGATDITRPLGIGRGERLSGAVTRRKPQPAAGAFVRARPAGWMEPRTGSAKR